MQIKIRCWDVKNKKWAWCNPSIERLSLEGKGGYYQLYANPEDYVFSVWSGIIDKHGKDVYEGDICNMLFFNSYDDIYSDRVIVEFKNGFFGVRRHGSVWPFSIGHGIEIIGNIFQNPEFF
jgi:hypothetical protein